MVQGEPGEVLLSRQEQGRQATVALSKVMVVGVQRVQEPPDVVAQLPKRPVGQGRRPPDARKGPARAVDVRGRRGPRAVGLPARPPGTSGPRRPDAAPAPGPRARVRCRPRAAGRRSGPVGVPPRRTGRPGAVGQPAGQVLACGPPQGPVVASGWGARRRGRRRRRGSGGWGNGTGTRGSGGPRARGAGRRPERGPVGPAAAPLPAVAPVRNDGDLADVAGHAGRPPRARRVALPGVAGRVSPPEVNEDPANGSFYVREVAGDI